MTDVTSRAGSRRREQTRARLLDAAHEVFAEVGMDAASVEMICERAGFTRGAFYSNFATKDDLCVEIMRHVAEEQVDTYQAALNGAQMAFRPDLWQPYDADAAQRAWQAAKPATADAAAASRTW